MLKNFTRAVLVAAALATGIAGLSIAPAAAAPLGAKASYQLAQYHHDRHYRDYRHRPMGNCSPREAVRKASRMGLRHARLVRANPRQVVVSGERHRRHTTLHFAQLRGCPLIRR